MKEHRRRYGRRCPSLEIASSICGAASCHTWTRGWRVLKERTTSLIEGTATARRRAGPIKFLGSASRAADRGILIEGRRRVRHARCACCSATRVCRRVIMKRSSANYVLDGMPQRLSSKHGVRFLESRPGATPMPEARATRRPEERRAVRLALDSPPRRPGRD